MIKKIIQLADLHIPNDTKSAHTEEKLKNLVKSIIGEIGKDKKETRIVIVGDIYQNKIKVSNEAKAMFHYLLNFLNKITTTYVVAGNHDMLQKNKNRLDSISTTFSIEKVYPNVYYLDKKLGYKSGYLVDDNIVFALFSMFDDFKSPNIDDETREKHSGKRLIALYHGDVVGSVTDLGHYSEVGIDTDLFEHFDCVMAGHIHKFQEIKRNGVPIVYSGSMFQKDFGENVSGHGYVVWDMETMKYELKEVDNDYRMYKFTVNDYEDVKNDMERLMNL